MGTGTAVGDPTGGLPEWRFLTSDGLKFILAVVQTDTEGNPIGGSSAPTDTNLTEVGGAAIALGSALSAHSLPVVIASDQAAIPVKGSGAVGTDQSTGLFTTMDAVVTTGPVTITGNATPAAGPLAVGGLDTFVFAYNSTGWTGSVVFTWQLSYDGGATWAAGFAQEMNSVQPPQTNVTVSTATIQAWLMRCTGATHVRVNATSYSSGGTNPVVLITASAGWSSGPFIAITAAAGIIDIASQNPTGGGSRLCVAVGVAATTSLSAVTSTGAGTAVDLGVAIQQPVMAVLASAVTTGGTIVLQGSLDNTNWYTIASGTISANGTTVVAATTPTPARYLRANLTVRTDGTYTALVAGA